MAKQSAPKEPQRVTFKPDERVHLRLQLQDRDVDYFVLVGHDGSVRLVQSGEPAPPVSDPDPRSGT